MTLSFQGKLLIVGSAISTSRDLSRVRPTINQNGATSGSHQRTRQAAKKVSQSESVRHSVPSKSTTSGCEDTSLRPDSESVIQFSCSFLKAGTSPLIVAQCARRTRRLSIDAYGNRAILSSELSAAQRGIGSLDQVR